MMLTLWIVAIASGLIGLWAVLANVQANREIMVLHHRIADLRTIAQPAASDSALARMDAQNERLAALVDRLVDGAMSASDEYRAHRLNQKPESGAEGTKIGGGPYYDTLTPRGPNPVATVNGRMGDNVG